jgi:hypothetical protein
LGLGRVRLREKVTVILAIWGLKFESCLKWVVGMVGMFKAKVC